MSEQRLSTILAFCFGVVFLAALLAIVIIFPDPTDRQFEIIRTVLALAAGGVAAAIPGLLNLQLGAGSKLAIRAGGAIAVFVVVYFYSPAHGRARFHSIPMAPIRRPSSATTISLRRR